MDLLPTDDQQAIAEAAAKLLADRDYPNALRALPAGTGIDAGLWDECAALGWLGLGLPESAGGIGLGPAAEVMLFRELGRHLAPGPFLATVVAAHAALALGDERLARALAEGRTRAALGEAAAGTVTVVGDAHPDVVLVTTPGTARLIEPAALGPVDVLPPLDPTVVVGRAPLPAGAGRAVDAATTALRLALLSAAALTGIAEATRDMAVAHAKVRVQFGQPIGAFQAVKHRCADMAVRAEAAWAQVCFAAATLEGDGPDAGRQAASAKVMAIEAARANAAATIQIHGGMGFTEELDAHLYVRRAHVYEQAGGGRRIQLATVLDR